MSILIISGGQTGADQAGLDAAVALGLPTGGWIPKGGRTELGSQRELITKYGLKEHSSSAYPPRTKLNVQWADMTICFGRMSSPGCRLTKKLCSQYSKQFIYIPYWQSLDFIYPEYPRADMLTSCPEVINIAGNRESSNPGIYKFTREYLIELLDWYSQRVEALHAADRERS